MSTLKIGFHGGPGGNHTGIGEYLRLLDEAGIPFVIKTTDHYGPIFESHQYSNAPHVRVFRLTDADYPFDTPPYKDPAYANNPRGAADLHWQQTIAALPPEFDRQKVWLEVMNEVDKNFADWLGAFGIRIGELALEDGYKVALFGWASGEPEVAHWEEPNMLACLEMCAVNPARMAIALHEYSFTNDDIFDAYPYKVGRYQFLFQVCDDHGIPRPTTIMTEWGWEYDDIPPVEKAMADINAVAMEYALHENIIGAAVWGLLTWGDNSLANKTQKLIEPVTQLALNTTFPEPIPPPTPEPPGPEPDEFLFGFEAGWTDMSERIQVPNGSEIILVEPGSPLPYAGRVATGTVEAMHKLNSQLPPNEQRGGEDALILEGEASYKIQAVSMASGTIVRIPVDLKGKWVVSVPVQCHYQEPDGYDREPTLEENDVYAALWLNGVEVDVLQFPELVDREWVHLGSEARDITSIELVFQTSYANNRDLFVDSIYAFTDGETMKKIKYQKNDIFSGRGWAGHTVKKTHFRVIHNDGSANVLTDWIPLELPDLADIRGLEVKVVLEGEVECDDDEEPSPPGQLEIVNIVADLEKHPTKSYNQRPGGEADITVVTIHHTVSGSNRASIDSIASYHVNTQDWPGIAYHYCITQDGTIYQTNHLVTKSFHSGGNNHYSIGIALLGDFTEKRPTNEQEDSALALTDWLVHDRLSKANYIWPHREMPAAQTQCPGNTYNVWFPGIADPQWDLPIPSEKFMEGNLVVVTSNSALNLRSTPFGAVLGSYPTETQMRVISPYPVQATGFVWWEVEVDGNRGWVAEDYIVKVGQQPTDPPPTGDSYDLSLYFSPPPGQSHSDILIKKNNWGQGDERTQLIDQGGFVYVTKGSNHERYRITTNAIYYEVDTSRSDDEMHTVASPQGWIARNMTVGQTHSATEDVTVMSKSDCGVITTYSGSFTRKLHAYHASYTVPESGFTYSDVLELWWVNESGVAIEKHWLAPGLPRLRWWNDAGRTSWVHEHIKLGDQGNNEVNLICS